MHARATFLAVVIMALFLPALVAAQTSGEGQKILARMTCYAPGWDPKMEGPFATSRPGMDGKSLPRTLDDFRLGKSKYVSLAANPAHYKKWYDMGNITYVSNIDHRSYTINKVVGYVHDTGCAFWGPNERFGGSASCCVRYRTCSMVHRKFDIAYGDYRAGGNIGLVNSGTLCGNVDREWTQIDGPLTEVPVVTPGDYVTPVSSNRPTASGQPQTIGQAYQGNEPTKSGYPQAMPSQQAQPVHQQPTQHFPQSGATPASSPTQGSVPLDSSFMKNQPEPITSMADRLLDMIRGPSDGSASSSPTKGISVSVGVSKKKVAITSTNKTTSTTSKTTVAATGTPSQTFPSAPTVAVSSRSPQVQNSGNLLLVLQYLRDTLAAFLHTLQSLRIVR